MISVNNQRKMRHVIRQLEAHGGVMRESADVLPRGGGENDEELGKWIDGPAAAPADRRSGRRAELPARPSQREAVRFVVAPVVAHGTSLGVTVASAAHGHVKIASLAPQSPLAGKLWPGDVVMLIDGESTTHLTPDEAQRRLDDAPGIEHSLLICAEEDEEEEDDDGALTIDPKLLVMADGAGAAEGGGAGIGAGMRRTQLVRQPSIAKTFAVGTGSYEANKQAAAKAAAAEAAAAEATAAAAQPTPPASLSAATDTAVRFGKRLIYRATFEGGGTLGFSIVDGLPVTVGQVRSLAGGQRTPSKQ